MNSIKIDLSDPTLYVWCIKPKSKLNWKHFALLAIIFAIMPLIYFLFFFLIGLLSIGIAKAVSIFFLGAMVLFSIVLFFYAFQSEEIKNTPNQYFKEVESAKQGWYDFMKAAYITVGTSSLLYLIFIDFYSIGRGFTVDMTSLPNVMLYYFENLMSILCFDIPSKFGVSLIDAQPVYPISIASSVLLNIMIGAGAIQFVYMLYQMRQKKEFTGTISDCYHHCQKYVTYLDFQHRKKPDYLIEVEGIVQAPHTPIIFDINEFCDEGKKSSAFG